MLIIQIIKNNFYKKKIILIVLFVIIKQISSIAQEISGNDSIYKIAINYGFVNSKPCEIYHYYNNDSNELIFSYTLCNKRVMNISLNGNKNVYQSFYSNGQLCATAQILNNQIDGVLAWFDKKGVCVILCIYKKSILDKIVFYSSKKYLNKFLEIFEQRAPLKFLKE